MARSKWVQREYIEHLLFALMRPNAEALRLSMDYGLRIGDVLRMPRSALDDGVYRLKEEKTGKRRTVHLSESHVRECYAIAGRYFVFEHRLDVHKHRTRQAVYKDLKRLCSCFRLEGVSPHSARKIYSVEKFHQTGDVKKVQKLLNHSDESVTLLYALADQLSAAQPHTWQKGASQRAPKSERTYPHK